MKVRYGACYVHHTIASTYPLERNGMSKKLSRTLDIIRDLSDQGTRSCLCLPVKTCPCPASRINIQPAASYCSGQVLRKVSTERIVQGYVGHLEYLKTNGFARSASVRFLQGRRRKRP